MLENWLAQLENSMRKRGDFQEISRLERNHVGSNEGIWLPMPNIAVE